MAAGHLVHLGTGNQPGEGETVRTPGQREKELGDCQWISRVNLKRKSHPGSPDESSSVPTLLFYYLEENDFTNFLQMMAKCIELVCFVPLHRPSHF